MAPASNFSLASWALKIPPTPIITISGPAKSLNFLMTAVLLSVTGLPLKPPCSEVIEVGVLSPSRLIVVLVAITPFNLTAFTISTISAICSSLKSGAIFKSTGFGVAFARFKAITSVNNFVSGSLSCNALKPGVLGELTFTTK